MAEDWEKKPVIIGFEGVTVEERQSSEQPATPSKPEGGEEIQLLTPEEQVVQV